MRLRSVRRANVTNGWVGGAPDGRQASIDPRDVSEVAASFLARRPPAPSVLELTGPELFSYTEVAASLTVELDREITYRAVDESALREQERRRGLREEAIQMHIERDRATQAGENARLTGAVRQILRRAPRGLPVFIHEHRDAFLSDRKDVQ